MCINKGLNSFRVAHQAINPPTKEHAQKNVIETIYENTGGMYERKV